MALATRGIYRAGYFVLRGRDRAVAAIDLRRAGRTAKSILR